MDGTVGPKGRAAYGSWGRQGPGVVGVSEITVQSPRSGRVAWNRPPS
ncbi:hypothetical protein SNOUR_05445 [Streptomyces noursei ATCC 11455]|nr:hypothetical protein SNOUR_05445 [Streptomyces noursei ATCC 11455]